MKKLLLLALLVSATVSFAQTPGDMSNSLALSATCSTATATCGATAYSQLMVPSSGFAAALVSVSGTYTGSTFFFEMSTDGDVTYYPVQCARTDVSLLENTEALGSSDKKAWLCPLQGTTNFRVRQSARSTGSPYVVITLTRNPVVLTLPDPCQTGVRLPFQVSGTATALLITGTTGKKTIICSFKMVVAAAQNVAIVEGTGATCGSNTVTMPGITGGTTAATGDNLAANGGEVYGAGVAWIGYASVAGDNVCALLANAVQTNIVGTYVQQ